MFKNFLSLFILVLGLGRLNASVDHEFIPKRADKLASLPYLLRADDWDKVRKVVDKKNHISLAKLNMAARYHKSKPLLRAIKIVKEIRNIPLKYHLPKDELLKTALFMETQLPKYTKSNQYHISRKKSGLSFAVEYDPENKNKFILLDKKIGSGKRKVVTFGLLYDKKKPQAVARGTQKDTKVRRHDIRRELNMSRKLRSSPGVVETKSITKTHYYGNDYHSIFYSFYNNGSLSSIFKKNTKFSLKEKVDIACDIITGLHSLHSKKIAHADLGYANYLVNINEDPSTKKRVVKACIADLGRADYISHRRVGRIQGHSAYTPPEALDSERMKGDDYLRADVYAVGCALYRLLYEKNPTWCDGKWINKKYGSVGHRYKKLVNKINKKTKARRIELDAKLKSGYVENRKEAFEHLVLYMVHPDPFKRGDASDLKEKISKIQDRFPK